LLPSKANLGVTPVVNVGVLTFAWGLTVGCGVVGCGVVGLPGLGGTTGLPSTNWGGPFFSDGEFPGEAEWVSKKKI
jgi:hypothetical protein